MGGSPLSLSNNGNALNLPSRAVIYAGHFRRKGILSLPQPPGGMEGLMQYLGKNIKYPSLALRNQVEGKVFVNFVVGPSGQITDVKVTKGIGSGCDEEAVRVIKNMPAWAPGKQNGRAVSVSYTVPVTFTIK